MTFYPAGGSNVAAPLQLRSTGSLPVFGAGTTGDTSNRVEMDADGFIRWGPGNAPVEATAFIGRFSAGVIQCGPLAAQGAITTQSDVDVQVIGHGFQVREGTNAKQGIAVLVAGTVTVANTSVTANSRIFLTTQVPGGTAGFLVVSARTAGTSFTILSSNAADTSTVGWEIFEPG